MGVVRGEQTSSHGGVCVRAGAHPSACSASSCGCSSVWYCLRPSILTDTHAPNAPQPEPKACCSAGEHDNGAFAPAACGTSAWSLSTTAIGTTGAPHGSTHITETVRGCVGIQSRHVRTTRVAIATVGATLITRPP